MNRFNKLFKTATSGVRPRVIGMVHVAALPGSPLYCGHVEQIIEHACAETEMYLDAGVDSIMVENMHDIPYIRAKCMGPETVAMMTRICAEIKSVCHDKLPLGLQVLAGGNKEAIAVALATRFNYIRAESFVFGHIADEGYMDACAGELLRYRRNLLAEDILVFTDIKKKHSSHAVTSDVSLTETAKAAEFFLSDGLILTGTATGCPAAPHELQDVKACCHLPVLIGSGVSLGNWRRYAAADAFIIGSHFKQEGKWENALDVSKVRIFMEAIS